MHIKPLHEAIKKARPGESAVKVTHFRCPECGGHHLDQWITGLGIVCGIVGVTQEGQILYDYRTETVNVSGTIFYKCRDCDFSVPCEDDDDEFKVAAWILRKYGEYADKPSIQPCKEKQAGALLKFTCPQCGGHKLVVVRLDACEVTPVEFLSDNGELCFGRMTTVCVERVFRCHGCDFKLEFDTDDFNSSEKPLVRWLINHCLQE